MLEYEFKLLWPPSLKKILHGKRVVKVEVHLLMRQLLHAAFLHFAWYLIVCTIRWTAAMRTALLGAFRSCQNCTYFTDVEGLKIVIYRWTVPLERDKGLAAMIRVSWILAADLGPLPARQARVKVLPPTPCYSSVVFLVNTLRHWRRSHWFAWFINTKESEQVSLSAIGKVINNIWAPAHAVFVPYHFRLVKAPREVMIFF